MHNSDSTRFATISISQKTQIQILLHMCTSLCQKKSLNFASSSWWHLKVGMETPENDFQIYRPINDPRRAVSSLGGDIGGGMSKNRFRAITFDWSVNASELHF